MFRRRPIAPYIDTHCSRCGRWLRVGWNVDINKHWQCPFCGNGIGCSVQAGRDKFYIRRGRNESRIVELTVADRDATCDSHKVFLNKLRDIYLSLDPALSPTDRDRESHRIYNSSPKEQTP